MEWSFMVEAPVFNKLTFLWFLWELICIDQIKHLVFITSLGIDANVVVLSVVATLDFHDLLILFIDKVPIFPHEVLPPS
jgi:hypothetical protein